MSIIIIIIIIIITTIIIVITTKGPFAASIKMIKAPCPTNIMLDIIERSLGKFQVISSLGSDCICWINYFHTVLPQQF